jgi:capsular polysaccharide biosynthesis protein
MYTSNLLLGRVLEEKLLDRKDTSELILETDSTYIPTIDADFTSSSIDEEVSYDSDHDGTPDILKDKLNFGSEGDSTLYKIYVNADFLHRNFSLANAFSLDFEMPMGEMYDDDDEGILLEYDPLKLMDDEDDLFSSNYTSLTLKP